MVDGSAPTAKVAIRINVQKELGARKDTSDLERNETPRT